MRLLLALVLAVGAWGACPTDGGYTSTCFIATTGNDTTGDGTISAPFATFSKAHTTAAAGDTIMFRAGTYSGIVTDTTKTGTSSARITVQSFPGEVVVQDGISAGYVSWLTTDGSPPVDVGYWTIKGMLFRNWSRPVIWMQSRSNDGFELRGVRFVDNNFTNVNIFNSAGMSITGSSFDLNELGPYEFTADPDTDTFTVAGGVSHGFRENQRVRLSTTGTLPAISSGTLNPYGNQSSYNIKNVGVNTFQLWNLTSTYDVTDAGTGTHTIKGFRGPAFNCTPNDNNTGNYGCEDLYIADTQVHQDNSWSSDLDIVALERGNRVLMERVSVVGNCAGDEASAQCGDGVDTKASNLNYNRLTVRNARNLLKVWGYENSLRNVAVGGSSIWESIVFALIGRATLTTAETSGDYIKLTMSIPASGGTIPRGALIDVAVTSGCPEASGQWEVDHFDLKNEAYIGPASCSTPGSGGTVDTVHSSHGQYVTAISDDAWEAYKVFRDDARNFVVTASDNIYYHDGGTFGAFCVSQTTQRTMDGNVFYSTRGATYSYGFGVSGPSCTFNGEAVANEPASVVANPNLDLATFRATSSSPTSVWNKGYYAGLHELVGVSSTAAIVKNLFPSATESVTATVSANTDFSSPVETLTITTPGAWRYVVFGKETPLAAGTTYYYKLQQGYDVVTGSFDTLSAAGGSETLSVSVTAPTGLTVADAVLETSLDGSSWTPQSPVACVASCALTASLTADAVYYRRWKFRGAGETVLTTSAAEPVSLR